MSQCLELGRPFMSCGAQRMAGGLALHLRSVRPMGLRSSGMSCTSSGAALTGAAPALTGPTWGSAALQENSRQLAGMSSSMPALGKPCGI